MNFVDGFEKTALNSNGKAILKHFGTHALGGAALGGIAGGLEGASRPLPKGSKKITQERFKHNLLRGSFGGAVLGGLTGLQIGGIRLPRIFHHQRFSGNTAKGAVSGLKESMGHLGLTGKETHKAHVRKSFLEMSKKHHPDKGGSETMQKRVNSAWENIKDSDWYQKLAYLTLLSKTASLSQRTKAQLMMGGAGALTGALAGAVQKRHLERRVHHAVFKGQLSKNEGRKILSELEHPAKTALKSGLATGITQGLTTRPAYNAVVRTQSLMPLVGVLGAGGVAQILSQQHRFNSPAVRRLFMAESRKEKK